MAYYLSVWLFLYELDGWMARNAPDDVYEVYRMLDGGDVELDQEGAMVKVRELSLDTIQLDNAHWRVAMRFVDEEGRQFVYYVDDVACAKLNDLLDEVDEGSRPM